KDPLTVLSDVEEVYVYFSMHESDFLYFSTLKAKEDSLRGIRSSENSLTFPDAVLVLADGEEYSARGPAAAIKGPGGRTTGAVSVRGSLREVGNILRAGSRGTLKIPAVKKSVIQIPHVAASDLQDKTFVNGLNDDKLVERRAITIG